MDKNFDVELFKRLFGVEAAVIEEEQVHIFLDIVGRAKEQQCELKHMITGWVVTDGVRHRFQYLGKCEGLNFFQEHIDVRYILSRIAKLSDEELLQYEFKIVKS